MEQKININPEEVQHININTNTPQSIKLKNVSLEAIDINESFPQNVNITDSKNQIIYIDENGKGYNVNDVLVNGESVVVDGIAYVIVPTKTSDLNNDSGFITKSVNNLTNYTLTSNLNEVALTGNYNDLSNKPSIPTKTSELTNNSGYITNTVNNLTNYTLTSNLNEVALTGDYTDLINKPSIPTKTSELTNNSGYITNSVNDLINYTETSYFADVAFSGVYDDLTNLPTIPTTTSELVNDSGYITDSYHDSTKQDTLVSGTNIKTINNESILGSGNITVGGGGTSTDVQINGTSITSNNVANIITQSTYNSSTNKIATMSDLPTVPTKTSDLNNDSGFITNTVNDLTNYTNNTTMGTWTDISSSVNAGTNYTVVERRVFVNPAIKLCYVHFNVKATSTNGDFGSGFPKALLSLNLSAINMSTNQTVTCWVRNNGTIACATNHSANNQINICGCYPYSSL